MSIDFKRMILPAACLFGLIAAPALAQTSASAPPSTMAPNATPSTMAPNATPSTMAPSTPTPAASSGAMGTNSAMQPTHLSNGALGASHRFTTVAAATAHCPTDTVVWTTGSKSKAYHLSTSKYYGKTKHGFYACKAEADTAGFHQTSK